MKANHITPLNETRVRITLIGSLLCCLSVFTGLTQTGPGGIGDTSGTSSLQLWLRLEDCNAEKTFSDGQIVEEWLDHSGAKNHVYQSNGQGPHFESDVVANHGGIRFEGNQYLQTLTPTSGFSNSESTFFVVYQGGRFDGTLMAVAEKSWDNEYLIFNSGAYHHTASGNWVRQGHQCIGSIPNDQISIATAVFGTAPTDLKFLTNGLASNESFETPGNALDFKVIDRIITIGQRGKFVPSEYYTGVIFEVIGYKSKLEADQINSVLKYLHCKYRVENTTCNDFDNMTCPECDAAADFTISKDRVEINECIEIQNSSSLSQCATLKWTFTAANQDTSLAFQPGSVCFLEAGTQVIKLIIEAHCGRDTLIKSVEVVQQDCEVEADFTIVQNLIYAGECLNLVNESRGGISLWNWRLSGANNLQSDQKEPGTFCLEKSGNQQVSLMVEGDCGRDTIIKQITVLSSEKEPVCFAIPNAFSPNGDQINDHFGPILHPSCDIQSFDMKIFDRWGTMLFATKDPLIGWAGQITKNDPLPGVYLFWIGMQIDGEYYQKSGTLHLIK
ncbi:MAG: gliding motility-associated C-terminal domain-containing protein [Saprospiraceae bacterium]|nr:gliding motility-associated C-terminal domain-containing protein [Saprospiraceae bacterium]